MTRPVAAFLAVLLVAAASASAGLRADELLLLTDRNDADSGRLAAKYAVARGVPDGHTLALDVPPGEEVTPELYERSIATPVRQFLTSPAGQGIRCLVTFYGLPLRVTGRAATEADTQEAGRLRALAGKLDAAADALAPLCEANARALKLPVPPRTGNGVQAVRRQLAVLQQEAAAVQRRGPDAAWVADARKLLESQQQHSTDAARAALDGAFPPDAPAARPVTLTPAEATAIASRPRDPAARQTLRSYAADAGGIFALYDVVVAQVLWTETAESVAAVDSELALVRLADFPRSRWQPNPMHFGAPPSPVQAIMTCRLDAPTAQGVEKIIDDSVAVEAAGLAGKAVFDSRGLAETKDGKPDPYGWFDQAIRDTAAFVRTKTKLDVVTDDREALLPPRNAASTAVYCGWYSLRHYVASCGFARGAVGYHVASFELISLHDRFEKGWVANLIKEGVVATLGPVAEPYLQSFPRPDEMLPLLLTGRPTLAEAYWKTTPMTSWMQTLIGDPLYRPFAKAPALDAADLSPALQAALREIDAAPKTAATRSADR